MTTAHLSLRLLYRCVDRWGLAQGAGVWRALRGHHNGVRGAGTREVNIPGYAQPVWLRPGTSDVMVFEQIFLRGSLDGRSYAQNHVVETRAKALGDKATIIDGGANIGLASVWFAHTYPQATILAVEPDPGNVELLRRNAAPYPNILPIAGALWDRPTRLGIVNPDDAAWAFRVAEPAGTAVVESVNGLTMGELMGRAGADELLIVKLIIQGAEKAVFNGNLDWLDRTALVIFMPSDWAAPWGGAGRTAMAALARLPFDWIVRDLCLFCYRDPASPAAPGSRDPVARQ